MKRTIVIQLVVVLCLSVAGLIAQEGKISVEKVAENVYLYTYEIHRSLFVVTDDGILVTDPQSTERARPYLREIRKISQAPIRYVVYSHHHGDHVSGGAVVWIGSDHHRSVQYHPSLGFRSHEGCCFTSCDLM